MWQAFKDWRRRRNAQKNRAIFQYWDGRKTRHADPMQIYRELACHPTFIWSQHPQQVERDYDALRITLAALREVFHVFPLSKDGKSGLSDGETLGLLIQFAEFIDLAKKNTSNLLILPPPTVRASSTPISEPATKSDSDSSSTPNEPKPDVAEASESESSLPSENLP
jgi:hypothetical protein